MSANPPPTGDTRLLPATTNQALGLARYSIDFLNQPHPIGQATLTLLERFHLDSVGCGVSAVSQHANAPSVLRKEAMGTRPAAGSSGGICFGSQLACATEKAVLANTSAVREWDANGTNFGYDASKGRVAGEFGHNDFYPVALAAAREAKLDGNATLRVMLLIDEIRGRLAEVFPLRRFAIDHVHHGAVATAAAYAAAIGGNEKQIESAIGLAVSHSIPFRAIRAGHQLSDSKGASAAIAAEAAVVAAQRAVAGFRGPQDIFRNPLAIYRLNQPSPDGCSPFDLELGQSGNAFAIHSMHFKLGLYEHQSASCLQALINLIQRQPALVADPAKIEKLKVVIYEPAFSIIADPAKRTPQTRQSADHSLPYILSKSLLKAAAAIAAGCHRPGWAELMLLPDDYQPTAIADPAVRSIIERLEIVHGGSEYDRQYPEGIPTSVMINHTEHGNHNSGLVMFPLGHARSDADATAAILELKFQRLVANAVADPEMLKRHLFLEGRSTEDVSKLYSFPIAGISSDHGE